MAKREENRYAAILEAIFKKHYRKGLQEFEFDRSEIDQTADDLGHTRVKNVGDLLYSFRHRTALPASISSKAPEGREWVIEGAGTARYRFKLVAFSRILPKENQFVIKIPDATPEIIARYAQTDEQALLAKVRYNRLVDVFLRVTAYSLQNHLRTTVPGIGQIETDELYVAVRNTGEQFIIPVQAKGGTDQIGVVQVRQDLGLCNKAFPRLTPRLVAVQFRRNSDVIAMFELTFQGEELKILAEKHYQLVPAADISDEELETMAGNADD